MRQPAFGLTEGCFSINMTSSRQYINHNQPVPLSYVLFSFFRWTCGVSCGIVCR